MPRERQVIRAGSGRNLYPLLTASIVPRPIAWVSTLDADGVGNLAPHSFFTVAAVSPAVVSFTSVGTKDSLRNILATGEFTVSVTPRALLDAVNDSSAPYPPDVDEATRLGIAMEPSATVAPPRVAASPVAIECSLHSTTAFEGDCTVVFGLVRAIAIAPEALGPDDLPTIEAIAPLSRLGRNEWGLPPEVVRIDRPMRVED